ncbi:hypothetical protein Pcatena_05020 [Parolsenella catena]|uniref:HMA domain-containing protein n=2 Tax=Parolsenella catena TaxID=2003188 RepID=A0A3G9KAF9_9ACTN|nr:hypothetical protein Pcatena_05020 [Parolsenella catena]
MPARDPLGRRGGDCAAGANDNIEKGCIMNYTIKTQGIMCGHCEAKVESALLAVAGVTDAEADHETNVVTVEAEGVEPEQLKAAIEGASDTYKVLEVAAQ